MERAWLAGAVVVLVVLLAGSIDRSRTENKPPFPPQGQSAVPRFERIRELDEDFDRRAWIYGGIAAVAMGLATAGALAASSSPAGQRRVFSQAGVAGVVFGLAGFVLFVVGSRRNIDPPVGALLAPSLTLLAIAALGGTVSRRQPDARPPR